jgi:hypothetical protein
MFWKTDFCRNDYRHSNLFLEFPGVDVPVHALEFPGSSTIHFTIREVYPSDNGVKPTALVGIPPQNGHA